MTAVLTISRFAARIHPPTREPLTWQQLAALFSDPRRTSCTVATCRGSTCPHKDGACWSPAVFRGSKRSAHDVEAVSCLALDIDHATEVAIEALRAQLADYQHLIHVTHADRPDDRGLRVVIQLSRDVTPVEWSRFWRAAVIALGLPSDLACGDIARCYYLPSRPFDADYFAVVHAGEAFDVDAALAAAPILDDLVAQPAAQEGISP